MSWSYSLVVTSCGRFDLLAETLASFETHADLRPAQVIVTEDSGNSAVNAVVRRLYPDAEIIVNPQGLGQMRCIDLAYAKVAHDYIFHLEDDWQFFRGGFLEESVSILKAAPDVSMVGLRARDDRNKRVQSLPATVVGGVKCTLYDPALHPEYFSYSFNPGLRRLRDARAIGPFAPLGGEPDVSYQFKKAGFREAALEAPAVRHIGFDRHVDDPAQPKRATNAIERIGASVRKRVKRLRRALAADAS